MENKINKVIIIGSGPAGYTAAIYLGRAGYDPLVIAGALTPGGQLMNTTEVENYPGFPEGILGPDLMESMQKQAEKFGAKILLNDVTSVDLKSPVKRVTADDGITYEAEAVIVSTGSKVRKLGVPGEQEYSGRGVSYCATCDGFFFRGKPITVVGRRSEFRASKIMVDRAKENEKIKFILNSVVEEVHGNDVEATSLTVRNVITGETQEVESSGLFVAIGHTPETSFLNDDLKLNEDGTIAVDGATTRTSAEGVFAAGDVVDSIYRQAISAAGMGCRAALDAQAYLNEKDN